MAVRARVCARAPTRPSRDCPRRNAARFAPASAYALVRPTKRRVDLPSAAVRRHAGVVGGTALRKVINFFTAAGLLRVVVAGAGVA